MTCPLIFARFVGSRGTLVPVRVQRRWHRKLIDHGIPVNLAYGDRHAVQQADYVNSQQLGYGPGVSREQHVATSIIGIGADLTTR
jgi:hypothetical protein